MLNWNLNISLNLTRYQSVHGIKKFKNARELCCWNEETSLNILSVLIKDDLAEITRNFKCTETIFDSLIRHQYPLSDRIKFLDKLKHLQQTNFYTIEEYQKEISDTITNLGYCKAISPSEIKKRTEEAFISGLAEHTVIRLNELNIIDAEKIHNLINKNERIIIERLQNKNHKLLINPRHR